jgi:uncharacterized protein YbjT (DUF2867 family)
LVTSLVAGGHDVRVVARARGRARDLVPAPVVSPSVSPADATGLFLLGGDALPDADWLAAAGNVRRAVLVTSMVGTRYPDSVPGKEIRRAEELVRTYVPVVTILRPWEFYSNTLSWAPAIRASGMVTGPLLGRPSPAIDAADIAAVAVRVLTEDGHAGREYALTGPAELTVRDKIDALAGALGRHLSYVVRPDDPPAGDEVLAAVRMAGVSDLDSPGVLDTVETITGRPARPFAMWARENAPAFRLE